MGSLGEGGVGQDGIRENLGLVRSVCGTIWDWSSVVVGETVELVRSVCRSRSGVAMRRRWDFGLKCLWEMVRIDQVWLCGKDGIGWKWLC